MAAGLVAKPGSTYGPCAEPCGHKDCAADRKVAASLCRVCGDPVGYERYYYQEQDWTVFVHMGCAEEEEAKRQKEIRAPKPAELDAETKAALQETNAALNAHMGKVLGGFLGGKKKPGLPAGTRGKAQRNGRTLGSYLVNGDPVYAANALEAARTWVCHRDSRRFELTVASRRGGGFVEVRWSSGASVIDVQRLSQVGVSGWRSRRRAAGLPDDFAGMALNADNLPA